MTDEELRVRAIQELEFYKKDDTFMLADITVDLAIKALEQMPVTTTAGEGGVIYYPQVEGVTPTVVNPTKTGWIPMTTRPMSEEEQEYYREWSDVEGSMIFDCELPEDGQEVIVSHGGYVCVDTFCTDDGCYFEGVEIDDVEAWMPLPEPYKPQERGDKE